MSTTNNTKYTANMVYFAFVNFIDSLSSWLVVYEHIYVNEIFIKFQWLHLNDLLIDIFLHLLS